MKLQEWDWLDEGKNIEVSQSETEWGGSIPLPTWDTTGDLTQKTRGYYDDGDPTPTPHNFPYLFLQIYTVHVNDIFQSENCEFRRKVTSLHPWRINVEKGTLDVSGSIESVFTSWTYKY